MWGGEQTVGGPVLTAPFVESVQIAGGGLAERSAFACQSDVSGRSRPTTPTSGQAT